MKDNREFKGVVKTIERSEKDVDKVLKAARLQRIENGRMSGDDLEKILTFVKEVLFGIGVLAFVLMYFYFLTH